MISDSHGLLHFAQRAVQDMGPVDILLHAGDHYRDAARIIVPPSVPVHAVLGNCDSRTEGPDEKLLEVEELLLFLTHGHRYGVHSDLHRLYYRALELNAAVVVYGHTHISGYHWQDGILFFNPGSITSPRDGKEVSYGVLEISGGNINPLICHL